MNDNDIQVITALVNDELPPVESEAVLARMETDPELRSAYEEQLAVSSGLKSVPAVAMTAAERDTLHTALRTQLNLEDAPVAAAAAAASRWGRWWAPMTGLAAVAVIVVAFVIAPNLGSDDPEQVALAPAEITTTAAALADGGAESSEELLAGERSAEDNGDAPVTSQATEAPEESLYALSSELAGSELELPEIDEESLEEADLAEARLQSTTYSEVDLDDISACFARALANWPPVSTSLVGVTPDGESVIGSAIDPETGEESLLYINLNTCAVTASE